VYVCVCVCVCVAHTSAEVPFFARVFLEINYIEVMNWIVYYDSFVSMDSIIFATFYIGDECGAV
jgi:hypothetical protein